MYEANGLRNRLEECSLRRYPVMGLALPRQWARPRHLTYIETLCSHPSSLLIMPACTTVQTPLPPPSVQYQSLVLCGLAAGYIIMYTVFTKHQQRYLVLLLSLANLASPLTATIYLLLLALLQTPFRVSLQATSLTVKERSRSANMLIAAHAVLIGSLTIQDSDQQG